MKKRNYLIVAGIIITTFSCKKPEVIPPPHPNAEALTHYVSENIKNATQHFLVNANSPIYIYGESGTFLYLGADALVDSEGNLVTGNVDVELIEISKKTQMFQMNKATNGKTSSGLIAPLISGGELYISISQNGAEVTLTEPMQISMPTETYAPEMRKFLNTAEDGNLVWEMANDSLVVFEEDSTGLDINLALLPEEWGWINCDYFYANPNPRTTLTLTLPEGFTGLNTNIFISIDGETVFINYYTGLELPTGLEFHIIAAGFIDEVMHYTIHDVTMTPDLVEDLDDFGTISEEALMTLIEDLP